MKSPCENCWNTGCSFRPEPNCNECNDYEECMRQSEAEEQEEQDCETD